MSPIGRAWHVSRIRWGLIGLALVICACDGEVGRPSTATDTGSIGARDAVAVGGEDAGSEDAVAVDAGGEVVAMDAAPLGTDASGDSDAAPSDANVGVPDAAPVAQDAAPSDANVGVPDAAPAFPDASAPDAGLPPYTVVSRYGRQIVQFAVVQKNNGHERRMFIESSALAQMTPTSNVPNGEVIFMESLQSGTINTVYIREKVAGVWNSGNFAPGTPNYTTTPQPGCEGCHGAAAGDSTYTLPLLRRLIQTHAPTTIQCPQDSFNPCPLSVYEGP